MISEIDKRGERFQNRRRALQVIALLTTAPMPQAPTRAGLAFDFRAASTLVAVLTMVVALWVLMLVLVLGHAVDPWNNAFVIEFGPGFAALAAIPGVAGILWAHALVRRASLPWARWAKILARIGTGLFSIAPLVLVMASMYGWLASQLTMKSGHHQRFS